MRILFPMPFKDNLRKLRKEMGLTQQELAARAGVSQQIITHYETGVRTPKLEKAVRLAKVLQVPVEEIFGEVKTRKPADQKSRHKNSRTMKMQEVFESLPPAKQRSVLEHAKALVNPRA